MAGLHSEASFEKAIEASLVVRGGYDTGSGFFEADFGIDTAASTSPSC